MKGDGVVGEASGGGHWWWPKGEPMFQGLDLWWCREEECVVKMSLSLIRVRLIKFHFLGLTSCLKSTFALRTPFLFFTPPLICVVPVVYFSAHP